MASLDCHIKPSLVTLYRHSPHPCPRVLRCPPNTSTVQPAICLHPHSGFYTSTRHHAHLLFLRLHPSNHYSSLAFQISHKYHQRLTRYRQRSPLFIAILSLSFTALTFIILSLPAPYAEDPCKEQVDTPRRPRYDPCTTCGRRNLPTLEETPQEANQGSDYRRSRGRPPCNTRIVANGIQIFLDTVQAADASLTEPPR